VGRGHTGHALGERPVPSRRVMEVEIYFRLSNGPDHLAPDGVQRLRVDGQTIIDGSMW